MLIVMHFILTTLHIKDKPHNDVSSCPLISSHLQSTLPMIIRV